MYNAGLNEVLDALFRLGLTPQGDVAMKEAPLEDEAQDAGTAHPLLLPPCQACTETGRSLRTVEKWRSVKYLYRQNQIYNNSRRFKQKSSPSVQYLLHNYMFLTLNSSKNYLSITNKRNFNKSRQLKNFQTLRGI